MYAEYGISNADYYLTSMADEIYVGPMTGVSLRGLNMEVQFIRGLLDTLSIVPEVFRVNHDGKSYKTAGDGLLNRTMSDEMRENYTELLGDLFDVFVEAGIKTSDFDGEKFNFEGDDSHASFLAGIRFGNSNHWEGKIFLDASKEAVIIDTGNPVCRALSCPPYDAELSDDSDKKFGIGVLYNINNRSAFFLEASSSKVTDTLLKIGYQLNL